VTRRLAFRLGGHGQAPTQAQHPASTPRGAQRLLRRRPGSIRKQQRFASSPFRCLLGAPAPVGSPSRLSAASLSPLPSISSSVLRTHLRPMFACWSTQSRFSPSIFRSQYSPIRSPLGFSSERRSTNSLTWNSLTTLSMVSLCS